MTQDSSTTYRSPGADIEAIVDAPPTPLVKLSPGSQYMLRVSYSLTPPLEMIARPFHKLGGLRIDRDTATTRRTYNMFDVHITHMQSGEGFALKLPAHAQRVCSVGWSPDGEKLAITLLTRQGVELWCVRVAERAMHRVAPALLLNDTLGSELRWMPDSSQLIVLAVPQGRGAAPKRSRLPAGPKIQETRGQKKKNRTYTDLLQDEHDDALFAYYTTSEVWLCDALHEDAPAQQLGSPGMYHFAAPSPSGEYLLVKQTTGELSRVVPVSYFGFTAQVWDMTGALVRTLTQQPVADAVPIQGVVSGPRRFGWQPHKPATLTWVECLDGGDPLAKVAHRDRLMRQPAPFEEPATQAALITERYQGAGWLELEDQVLLSEYDRDRRWLTTKLWNLAMPGEEPRVIFDRSAQDRYNDPGAALSMRLSNGTNAIPVIQGHKILLVGSGATPQGDRPFLDLFDLNTLTSERLFHSSAERYEAFAGFGPAGEGESLLERERVLWRESPDSPPNYILHDPTTQQERALTHFADPHPQLTHISKQLITYERADGVPLSGTLYLPPGYDGQQKLPLVIWAYPREYSDASTAGQIRAQPTRFTRLGMTSPLMLLLRGYAVLDNATIPVVGDPETMNDTFVTQIVDAASAAIDAVDALGVIDRERVAVGGHSYGAFMTANLLAHSDLFKAGLARSGAYNRSLTPFGFQSERRPLWEAPETYVQLSPFFHAHKISAPLLLIHGEQDPNSGTFPLQSRRMFHALQGLGGTARLVILPHEEHGYRARASVLHVLAEQFDWLSEYL